jgi:hypothetical protein
MTSFLRERVFRSWIACWGAAGLSACSVGPDFKLPETELPGSYIAKLDTKATDPAATLAASRHAVSEMRDKSMSCPPSAEPVGQPHRGGETRETTSVAIVATMTFRISAPSPT